MNESTMLAVMTCEKCHPTLLRHWKYFLNQQADWNYIIATEKQNPNFLCEQPLHSGVRFIGRDSYINGPHLPKRMIDSIAALLELPWGILILAEYDTVIFKRLPVEKMECGIAGSLAGYETWGSSAKRFYHNPWMFHRESAIRFVDAGIRAIAAGVCGAYNDDVNRKPEASPDVFLGLVCESNNLAVQGDLWREYSRNDLKNAMHLHEARKAYLDGAHCVHGVKTAEELAYITG